MILRRFFTGVIGIEFFFRLGGKLPSKVRGIPYSRSQDPLVYMKVADLSYTQILNGLYLV